MEPGMKGYMTCPACGGEGVIRENTDEYMFESRDPITKTCLICMGKGQIPARQKLPAGRYPNELAPNERVEQPKEAQLASTEKKKPFRPPAARKAADETGSAPLRIEMDGGAIEATLTLRGTADDLVALLDKLRRSP
jgi:hypothetical protein